MEVYYTPHFKRDAKELSKSLRTTIEKRLGQFANNPHDPALKTHKLSGRLQGFWAFSIDQRIRVIFEFKRPNKAILHAIGDHSIYDSFM